MVLRRHDRNNQIMDADWESEWNSLSTDSWVAEKNGSEGPEDPSGRRSSILLLWDGGRPPGVRKLRLHKGGGGGEQVERGVGHSGGEAP